MTLNKPQEGKHHLYWENLRQANPVEVCRRTGATYNAEKRAYQIRVLDRPYLVIPEGAHIGSPGDAPRGVEKLRDAFTLMLLLYLLNAQEVEPASTWISGKDLPGGTTFFRGPHALRTEELKKRFGRNPDDFFQAGKKLGGVKLLFGDQAFALSVFPRVPLAYILWKEDSEFPAEVTVMFDSTIPRHFSLDGIFCLVAEVSERLLEAATD